MLEIENDKLIQICRVCLGSKANHTLIKDSAGSECRQCKKSFIPYNWKLENVRSQRTILCLECAESLECCQSCVLDIEFHISLPVRNASIRIMIEEGGSLEDKSAVLAAVAREYGRYDKLGALRKLYTLEDVIERLPNLPLSDEEFIRPDGCVTLCIYGIETDLDRQLVRAYFKSPIAKIEWMETSMVAFIEFTNEKSLPKLSDPTALIDGRVLQFAWGNFVKIPEEFRLDVGSIVRAQLFHIRANQHPMVNSTEQLCE